MSKSVFPAAIVTLAVLFGGVASADPIQSGPQAGQKVPGPFKPLHVTGPEAGEKSCLYCKNGANPVVAIFAREVTPELIALLKKIDAATAANADNHMGSFVVFLNDSPTLPALLRQIADKEGMKTTILSMDDPSGPKSYKIAAEAEVTVLLYTHHSVKANHAFRKGELNEAAVKTIVNDVPKILVD